MIRNYILDYNEKGIAKHSVIQMEDRGLGAEYAAVQAVRYIQCNGWVPVSVIEMEGNYALEELERAADKPPASKKDRIHWFEDRAEALKTLPQDFHRMKEFR